MQTWANYLDVLCLILLMCKVRVLIAPFLMDLLGGFNELIHELCLEQWWTRRVLFPYSPGGINQGTNVVSFVSVPNHHPTQ